MLLGLTLLSIMLSGTILVILVTRRPSFGCYGETQVQRIERSNEGLRRSEELSRQMGQRVIDSNGELMEDNRLTRDGSAAVLADLRIIRKELKSQYHPDHERSA